MSESQRPRCRRLPTRLRVFTARLGTVGVTVIMLALAQPQRLDAQEQVPRVEQVPESLGESLYAEVNGVRMHYRTLGSGTPLVLIHGFPLTSYHWRRVMPRLAAAGYRVIAPDLRGFGDSGRGRADPDHRALAADVRELVRSLGIERAVVVGHDVGGWVAFAYASTYPDAVTRLVLADCFIPGFGLEREMNPADGGSWHFGFNANPNLPAELARGRERQYISWFFENHGDVRGAISSADIDEYARTYGRPGGLDASLAPYRSIRQAIRVNRETVQRPLSVPVLAIGGGGSLAEGPATNARRAFRQVRGAVIDGCGHFLAEECPAELSRLIADFGRERPSRP